MKEYQENFIFDEIKTYYKENPIFKLGEYYGEIDTNGKVICVGKGNSDWNNSAPHGAGRALSRTQAKDKLSMKDYKDKMKNIFSSCVSISTLDEAPMAYKNSDEIIKAIEPTAQIIDHLKPLYNFKAEE